VLSDPASYGIDLYPIQNAMWFEIIDTGSQIDLAQVARLADVDMTTLYKLNPGVSRWATPPDGPHRILLPESKSELFRTALADLNPKDRVTWHRYKVQPGDTLSQIAGRYDTTTRQIAKANSIQRNRIKAGEFLLIPIASEANQHYVLSLDRREDRRIKKHKANEDIQWHTVRSGESWWSIAKRYGVTQRSLAKWNGKATGDLIRPGEKLAVHGSGKRLAARTVVTRRVAYTIRSGDSLSLIASKFNVTLTDLLAWNDLDAGHYLQPGQSLKINVAVAGTSL
jgi:membrane-bound lytic murein transglycosylase D